MRKLLVSVFSVSLLVLLQPSAKAQRKGFSIGPYLEGALPLGDFEKTHQYGVGGGVSADIKVPLTKFGVTASAGFIHFQSKDFVLETPENINSNAFPIRAGIKYRFSVLYAKLEAGAATFTDNKGTAFILSPGLGVRIIGLDIQAKYENWSKNDRNIGFAGLKVGYNF